MPNRDPATHAPPTGTRERPIPASANRTREQTHPGLANRNRKRAIRASANAVPRAGQPEMGHPCRSMHRTARRRVMSDIAGQECPAELSR